MKAQNNSDMFHFRYEKSSEEIITKMRLKISDVQAKVEERQRRIKNLREEYKITDAIYIDLLEQAREAAKKNDIHKMSYSISNASVASRGSNGTVDTEFTIGAGVVNNLLTEQDFVKAEQGDVVRMELIIRNLKDLPYNNTEDASPRGHGLSEGELKYLGF